MWKLQPVQPLECQTQTSTRMECLRGCHHAQETERPVIGYAADLGGVHVQAGSRNCSSLRTKGAFPLTGELPSVVSTESESDEIQLSKAYTAHHLLLAVKAPNHKISSAATRRCQHMTEIDLQADVMHCLVQELQGLGNYEHGEQ